MDNISFKKAIEAAIEKVNPKLSKSCPLLDLVEGVIKSTPTTSSKFDSSSLVQRLVLYSRAPPAMLYVDHLLSCTEQKPNTSHPHDHSSQRYFDLDRFILFFNPRPLDTNQPKPALLADDEGLSSKAYESVLDDAVNQSLVQAGEQLRNVFGSLSPSPKELLLQSLKQDDLTMSFDQTTVDKAFAQIIESALALFKLSNGNSADELIKLILISIDNASTNLSMMMVLAERVIFCCVQHPDESAGSDALLRSFNSNLSELQRLVPVRIPELTFFAAIEKLDADDGVKKLLKEVIVNVKLPSPVRMPPGTKYYFNMKMKFKVTETSSQSPPPPTHSLKTGD